MSDKQEYQPPKLIVSYSVGYRVGASSRRDSLTARLYDVSTNYSTMQ